MKLTIRENGSIGLETSGSYVVRRPVVGGAPGEMQEEVVEKARLSLCRCGASANKPFCDGSHKAAGFEAGALEIEIR
jgi:CDGSH iron-sulfur domain-containing protein 3